MKNIKDVKKKKPKKNPLERAYNLTLLDYGYTQQRITEMLNEIGISQVRFTQEGNDHVVEFIAKMQHDEHSRKVRINLPYTPDLDDKEVDKNKRKNVLYRVLFYHLKNKFVAVYNGLREFEEEFLPDLVILVDGEEKRLGEVIAPQYKEQLKHHSVPLLKSLKT